MSHKQLLSRVICLALMGGLLATCDWPQAAPTPAPPMPSSRPAPPTPSSTPAPPTSLPKEVPPTPTMGEQIVSRDFSDFTHFSFAQTEGSCGGSSPSFPWFEAEISRRPSGDYLFEASIPELGTPEVDQCISITPSECITAVHLPERTLTPAEADAVLDTFREVEIILYTPGHEQIECECTIVGSYFQWDSYAMRVKDCHDFPRLVDDRVLMSLLDQLATSSRAGLPTATPRRCVTYDVFPTYIWDIEIAPDHTVWIGTNRGAARYDPIQESWVTYTAEQGLPGEKVRSVTVAKDGSVWLAFKERVGASHYDGEQWRTYTVADGLRSNDVYDVAVSVDGTVWFAVGEGVSRWNPQSDTWESYDGEEGLLGHLVRRIRIAGDGSLWLSSYGHATHLTFDSDSSEPAWQNYDRFSPGAIGGHSLSFDNLTLAPDGKVWLQASDSLVFLDPNTETWARSSCCPWPVSTFALTDDGGLWAGNDGVDFFPQATNADGTILWHYDVDEGLASNVIHSLAVESDTVVWVGTDKGVSRCEAEQ